MKFHHIFRLSPIALTMLVLSGCGGEGIADIPVITPTELVAIDGFSAVKPRTNSFIDLSQNIRGTQAYVSSVRLASGDDACSAVNLESTGMNVNIDSQTLCEYEFTAEQPGGALSRAKMSVLSTSAPNPLLPSLSEAAVLGAGQISINLPEALTGVWKGTYSLLIGEGDIKVHGQDGFVGEAIGEGNVIKFTPPEISGWNRIVYTVTDTAAPDSPVMGEIYVTVSESINQPPKIQFPIYNTDFTPSSYSNIVTTTEMGCAASCTQAQMASAITGKGNVLIAVKAPTTNLYHTDDVAVRGQILTIRNDSDSHVSLGGIAILKPKPSDGPSFQRSLIRGDEFWFFDNQGSNQVVPVGTTHAFHLNNTQNMSGLNIVDPDGDDWQLIHVNSVTAQVGALNPNSVDNKAFNFTAATSGVHQVNYIVADRKGGYTPGVINVTTAPKGGAPTWDEVKVGERIYSAPQTYINGLESGYSVSELWDEGVNNTVAGYKLQTAQNYCSTLGVLPGLSDMQSLRNSAVAGLHKWPKAHPYLIKDADVIRSFNLTTGDVSIYYPESSNVYVTCLINNVMNLNMLTNVVVSNGQPQTIAKVIMETERDEFSIGKAGGTLNEDDVNIKISNKVGRVTELTSSSVNSGTYQFTISNLNDVSEYLTSREVRYIGDAETAGFLVDSGLLISRNNAFSNDLDVNELIATLTDANGNPVPDQYIDISTNEHGVINNSIRIFRSSSKTNLLGQIKFSITNTEEEDVDVFAEYINNSTGGIEVSSVKTISFLNKPVKIDVLDKIILPTGLTKQLTAVAHFSDGSVVDITKEAQWYVDDPSIASIDNSILHAKKNGTTNAVATYRTVSSPNIDITVTDAVPYKLIVNRPKNTINMEEYKWHYLEASVSVVNTDDSTYETKATYINFTNKIYHQVSGQSFLHTVSEQDEGLLIGGRQGGDFYAYASYSCIYVNAKVNVNSKEYDVVIPLGFGGRNANFEGCRLDSLPINIYDEK